MGAHGVSHSLPRQIFGIKRAHEQPSTCIHKPPLKKSPLPCQTHSTSNCLSQAMGEGVKVERSRPLAAGRSCLTPLEAKPPTSPKPQLHQPLVAAWTHQLHLPVVVMPRQRDVHGEHGRLARAKRALASSRAKGRPLGPRPTDIAATVARSRLLHHDLSAAAAAELHCP